KPLGQYSQITRVKASEFLFIAGQVGADKDGKTGDDFDAQCVQTFANIEAALKSQGASFANVVEFTTYLVHSQDIPKFMAYRERVTISSVSGGPEMMPAAPLVVPPALSAIHAKVTPKLGPHMLTGPVAVKGAKPGQVLQVDIEAIDPAYDWGYTAVRPLAGAL